MRYLFALIMLLCSGTALAATNDVLLNLRDPAATSPLFPTLPVKGPAVIFLEHRNAANNANVNAQAILIQASDTITYPRFCVVLTEVNQRIRLRLNTGVTGTMQASIQP